MFSSGRSFFFLPSLSSTKSLLVTPMHPSLLDLTVVSIHRPKHQHPANPWMDFGCIFLRFLWSFFFSSFFNTNWKGKKKSFSLEPISQIRTLEIFSFFPDTSKLNCLLPPQFSSLDQAGEKVKPRRRFKDWLKQRMTQWLLGGGEEWWSRWQQAGHGNALWDVSGFQTVAVFAKKKKISSTKTNGRKVWIISTLRRPNTVSSFPLRVAPVF